MNIFVVLLVSSLLFFACAGKSGNGSRDGAGSETGPVVASATPVPTPVVEPTSTVPPVDPRQGWVDCISSKYNDSEKIKITAPDQLLAFSGVSQNIALKAKVERRIIAGLDTDLKGRSLKFTYRSAIIGSAISDKDGVASLNYALNSTRNGMDCYEASHDTGKNQGRLFAMDPSTAVIVTDVDEVISDLNEVKVPVTKIENTPAMKSSVEALKQINSKYLIVYLSSRDDSLTNKTRAWLRLRDFPIGPTFFWDWSIANRLGLSRDKQGAYKKNLLLELKKTFRNIIAGVGNRPHDAEAYLGAGLKSIIINSKGSKSDYPAGTVFVTDWKEVIAKIP